MYKVILALSILSLASVGLASDSLYTTISGDTLTIHHDQTERNCGALFSYEVNQTDNHITVTEVDTGDQAWCMCYFDLEVSLLGLDPGSYQIDVWSDDLGSDPVFHGSIDLNWGGLSIAGHDESDCLTLRDDTSFVDLSVNGDTLTLFWNTPMVNCIFMPVWHGWLESDTFHITMVDTGPPVDCVCRFEVEVSFASFEAGRYTLDFWNGEYGYPIFNITGLRDGLSIADSYQSPCYDPSNLEDEFGQPPGKVLMNIQCYPNPFNSQMMIFYQLVQTSEVEMRIFNIEGTLVNTITSGIQPAGSYTFTWVGNDSRGRTLSSGIYFLVFRAGPEISMKRLLFLK